VQKWFESKLVKFVSPHFLSAGFSERVWQLVCYFPGVYCDKKQKRILVAWVEDSREL